MKSIQPLIVIAGIGISVPALAGSGPLDELIPAPAGATDTSSSTSGSRRGDTARDRLTATVEAAGEHWYEGRAWIHDAAKKRALARAESAPPSPEVVFLTEGWDGSFDRAPNAQDTIQAVIPFNTPGQTNAVRRYAEAADHGFETDLFARQINVVREAGRRWVEQAAAVERLEVRRVRVARVDEALSLHEARYQLGEVAGTEVMQLDLEHVRETSQLAAVDAENVNAGTALKEICGTRCQLPEAGDLEQLVHQTTTPPADELTVDAVDAGGLLAQARAASASSVARSELVSRTAYGRPSLGVGWEHFPTVDGLPSYDAWGAILIVPLPIGRAGKQTKAAAREEAQATQQRIESTRRELLRRAVTARKEADAAAQRLSTLDTVLSDLGSIEHSLAQQFRLGGISYLAYLDGLARLDEVRLQAVEARRELLLARLELGSILADPSVFPLPPMEEGS